MTRTPYYIILLIVVAVLTGCKREGSETLSREDKQAKQMLQGIWIDDENENAVFWAKGDSIFYPDSSSQPAQFWIYGDSLYIKGSAVNHYKITKQASHLFKFINDMGEEIKLTKDPNNSLAGQFNVFRPYAMNIFRSITSDSLFYRQGSRWEVKIHVQPTSDRVIKSDYNDVGLEVDNLYLDNNARVTLLFDGVQVYSHEFQKAEFERLLPRDMYPRFILRDMRLFGADSTSVYVDAVIGIPDATSSYVIQNRIQRNGKISMRLK